jgi:hypothetical protein
MNASAKHLRELLDGPELLLMPCCFDALSARLVEQAGFPLTFMSGFALCARPRLATCSPIWKSSPFRSIAALRAAVDWSSAACLSRRL